MANGLPRRRDAHETWMLALMLAFAIPIVVLFVRRVVPSGSKQRAPATSPRADTGARE